MENTEIIWKCYQEGFMAWDIYAASGWRLAPPNPYLYGTDSWKSWNRGWNANYCGVDENRRKY